MNRLGTRSRGVRWLAVTALTIPLAVFATSSALADDGPYNIDGTIPDDANFDNLPDPFGNVKELGPVNASTTKIGVIHNDAVPTLDLTNPNAQVDLRQAWLDTAKDPTTDHDWLYFAWERDKNTGSGFIAYEFMQDPAPAACDYENSTDAQLIASCNPWANRQAGDFMILWDQQGNSLDLFLRTWTEDANGNLVLGAPIELDDTVSAAAYGSGGFRGEAAIDLTATIFGGSTDCLSFANTIPSTVTGNSDTADYKDTILQPAEPITNCESTTVTTPKDASGANIPAGGLSIGSGIVGAKDSAVVDVQGGNADPAGSVAFFLCKVDSPGLCTTGGTSVGTTNLPSAATQYPVTVVSPTAFVTSAGRYCWRAEFSGDSANGIPGSDDSSANECFTVNPVTPTLATSAGADVTLGQPVTDVATLSGTARQPRTSPIQLANTPVGALAGGSITFKLFGPTADGATGCGSLVYTSDPVPVSGDGNYNAQFTPTQPGNYHWVASYSGNPPNTNSTNHNTNCTDTAEDVTVTTVPSKLSTAQRWLPRDNATISANAGGALAGTVTFTLYNTNNCTGTPLWSDTVSVSGASPQTVNTTQAATQPPAQTSSGDFSWGVSYDSTNPAQRDIPSSCEEKTVLTINNGNEVQSP